jgi:hypothetical protein
MTSYMMVYKAMSHVTLPHVFELFPAPTLVTLNKQVTFRIALVCVCVCVITLGGKCSLFSPDFNKGWNVLTNFVKTVQY